MFPLLAFILFTLTGCRSLPPLPKANLSESGWTILEGQAVWRAKKDAPEIAGEILLATNGNSRAFVQFSKTPFPIVIAQTTTNAWQIEAPAQSRRYARSGPPPARVLWLQLPRAFTGLPLPKKWSWKNSAEGWRLENISTGESLEGYFTQ
jgi:hypothetical protein